MDNKIEIAKNKGNILYNFFLNQGAFSVLEGRELIWRGKTKTSLELSSHNLKDPSDLIEIFGLDAVMFKGKFVQAIYGGGSEWQEIRTLHSSSLVALLCFYNVSALNPLDCVIDSKHICFTESLFEIQNAIPNSRGPSNVDVVLIGKDVDSGRKVTLYLESKFSEYLSWRKCSEISSRVYRKTYNHLLNGNYLKRMGLKYEDMPGKPDYFDLMSIEGDTHHYAEGIKQMISHFLGVKNAADSGEFTGCDIYLGEILFRFDDTIDHEGIKLKDYTKLYEVLAEGLNDLAESKFKVVNHCLTYQDVFRDFNLDKAVRTFYSL